MARHARQVRIADDASATFWLVLPSLPMFLVLPYLLKHGVAFWPSLIGVCLMTMALYLLTIWLLKPFGIRV